MMQSKRERVFLTTFCYQTLAPDLQLLLHLLFTGNVLRTQKELNSEGMFSSVMSQPNRTKFLGSSVWTTTTTLEEL